jgi:hypothetical protein
MGGQACVFYGAAEFSRDTDIALLAEPDPARIATQVADLLADRAELEARSRRGLKFAATFPSEEEMGARIAELIERKLASEAGSQLAAAAPDEAQAVAEAPEGSIVR